MELLDAKVVPTSYAEQVLHSLLSMFTEWARQSTNANHKAGQLNTYKLVISKRKKDSTTKYIISTNGSLSAKEILSIYEDRWDIETAHREANQKLGFKDYQLRDKHSIERFIQMVFSVWTAILLWEIDNPPPKDGSKSRTMGDMVDRVKMQAVGETFEYVMTYFNLPVPDGGLLYILKSLGMKI